MRCQISVGSARLVLTVHVVAQLTGEIAVRTALGAKRSSVRPMVVVQSGRVALLGVVVGIVVASQSLAC